MKHLIASRYLMPLLCLTLLLFSCKKDIEEIEADPVVAWKVHDQFLHYNRYIANLYSATDKLQVLGMDFLSTISMEGGREKVIHYPHYFKNVSHHKHPISSRIFGGTDGNYLHLRSVNNPLHSGTYLALDVAKLDPQFRGFSLAAMKLNESFAISENHVALVPYTYLNEDTGRHGLRYLLVKLAVETNHFGDDRIVLEETLVLTPAEVGGKVLHMRSHGNNFYVGTDWGFYKITEDGEINYQMPKEVGVTSFEHKGNIYSIVSNWEKQTVSLMRSISDQTWSLDAQLTDAPGRLSYYAISDDLLLASYYSQIFTIELGIDKLLIRELDNTGLEGHFITSIAKVGSKVYIGTQSGLFSKEAEHLLTYKEEEKK